MQTGCQELSHIGMVDNLFAGEYKPISMLTYTQKLEAWRIRRRTVREWLRAGQSAIKIGKRLKISRQMVYKLANGTTTPRR